MDLSVAKNSLGKHIYMICVVYIQIKNWKNSKCFLKKKDQMMEKYDILNSEDNPLYKIVGLKSNLYC